MWTSVWTLVVDDVSLLPNTRRNFTTSIRVPASSILASFSLGASHGFSIHGLTYLSGRVRILRVLFEEIRYILIVLGN